jgi:uncharacterized alkaline shock family protein YloU
MKENDTITIAPNVLLKTAQQAALTTEGVAGMGNIPVAVGRLLKGHPMGHGVILSVDDQTVSGDLYLLVKPNIDMQKTGKAVQENVARAITELVGMSVSNINIHIENVLYNTAD